MSAFTFLPWVTVGPVSGVVVDRVDRRQLIVAVQVVRGLAAGGFAVAVATGTVTIAVVYAIALVIGIGETLADTAVQAAIPRLVGDPDRLELANSRLSRPDRADRGRWTRARTTPWQTAGASNRFGQYQSIDPSRDTRAVGVGDEPVVGDVDGRGSLVAINVHRASRSRCLDGYTVPGWIAGLSGRNRPGHEQSSAEHGCATTSTEAHGIIRPRLKHR